MTATNGAGAAGAASAIANPRLAPIPAPVRKPYVLARMALDRLLGTETRGKVDALVEWIAQGRAAAARGVRP